MKPCTTSWPTCRPCGRGICSRRFPRRQLDDEDWIPCVATCRRFDFGDACVPGQGPGSGTGSRYTPATYGPELADLSRQILGSSPYPADVDTAGECQSDTA